MTNNHTTTKSSSNNDVPTLTVDQIDQPISISRVIELRNKKLTYEEIGRILGCTKQNIHQRLQPFRSSIDNLQTIKDNRADTLTVISDTILNSLTADDIKKATIGTKVTTYGILYDKERLERGQTTANVGYADYTRDMRELDKEIDVLEAEIGTINDD